LSFKWDSTVSLYPALLAKRKGYFARSSVTRSTWQKRSWPTRKQRAWEAFPLRPLHRGLHLSLMVQQKPKFLAIQSSLDILGRPTNYHYIENIVIPRIFYLVKIRSPYKIASYWELWLCGESLYRNSTVPSLFLNNTEKQFFYRLFFMMHEIETNFYWRS